MDDPNHPKQVAPQDGPFSMAKYINIAIVWSNGLRNKYNP